MQVDHTVGLPPYQGRIYRAMIGWIWKRKKELTNIATAKGMVEIREVNLNSICLELIHKTEVAAISQKMTELRLIFLDLTDH